MNDCSGHGFCIGPDTCQCDPGWMGPGCEVPECIGVNDCSGHGECIGPDTCVCDVGWSGSACEVPDCSGVNDCSGNGICVLPDFCNCDPGWTGSACDVPECFGVNDCSGHGTCIAPNTCECDSGWIGAACNAADCNGNGIDDFIDLSEGTSQDCDTNGVPDECELDADSDGSPDACDNCPFEPALIDPSEPGTELTCDDLIDNDCDGPRDGSDPDCQGACCAAACEAGSDCDDIHYCGVLGAECGCTETAEGAVHCVSLSQACGAPCVASSDCAAGSVCGLVPACCGGVSAVCLIDQCPLVAARADGDGSSSLFSFAGESIATGFEEAGANMQRRGGLGTCAVFDEQTCGLLFGTFSGAGTDCSDGDADGVPDGCDSCPLSCGDISGGGGSVDLVDFASFAVCFGGVPSSSQACACSDMNQDGAINLVDFATFSLIFNGSSTNSVPNCP